MKERLRLIFCGAPKYREAIYKLIEQEWNCEWFFGRYDTDIKGLDERWFNNIKWIKNITIFKNWYWQKSVGLLLRDFEYNNYLITGDVYCLSTWWLLLQRHFIFRKRKIYLWSHGWYGREGRIKKWIKRIFFGMADHVFTYGEYAKKIAVSQGLNKNKITSINNSLDHSYQVSLRQCLKETNIYENHFGNKNYVLIFIGRLTKIKKLDLIIKALALAKERGHLFNLVLIGNGEMKDELVDLSNQLNLSSQIWFYGECYDDSKNAQMIYDADLCVAPGNVGLTALHTMVFGTPVLTHNDVTWQMPEFETIIDGKTGCFFKRDSVDSLVTAILNWIKTQPSRQNVRSACFEIIDEFWNPNYQLKELKKVIGHTLESF